MKIDAVGVTTSNMKLTIEFYRLIGFEFGDVKEDQEHVEPILIEGSARLMIDKSELIKGIIGDDPVAGNHSSFAIKLNSAKELDNIVIKIKEKGYKIIKEPWDAFWGQRYAIIADPDGYKIDLYSDL